jgi:hypothetical protein
LVETRELFSKELFSRLLVSTKHSADGKELHLEINQNHERTQPRS